MFLDGNRVCNVTTRQPDFSLHAFDWTQPASTRDREAEGFLLISVLLHEMRWLYKLTPDEAQRLEDAALETAKRAARSQLTLEVLAHRLEPFQMGPCLPLKA